MGNTQQHNPIEVITCTIEELSKMREKMLQKDQKKVKVGDIISLTVFDATEDYMLCRIGIDYDTGVHLSLIALKDGNRWNAPVTFPISYSHGGFPFNEFVEEFGLPNKEQVVIKGTYKRYYKSN